MNLSTLVKTTAFALVFCAGTAFAQTKEICNDSLDNDGDKLTDCADIDCSADPACGKKTEGCSPGYYKNHPEIWVGTCCDASTTPSCGALNTALTCRGSDASCGRSEAAEFLDACTGCTE